ncbi:hypothetical protein [Marinomonas primoryensis]|jgi:hypothetical protein|uniref:hypothetical protein n=1 Tax=Marinomonas primoryensis TaxID=178399 RepID=UPI003704AB65
MDPMDMSGGGGYSADFGATATNTGGTNTVGGTVFGNYSAPPSAASSMVPLLAVAIGLAGVFLMMKGGK